MAAAKKTSSNSLIMMVIVGVLVGWIVGFAIGATVNDEEETVNKNEESAEYTKEDSAHVHGQLEVAAANAPTVEIMATKDAKSGYNVMLKTTNFEFSPENASGDHVAGEGHAHVFVNGEKVGRVYGPWIHLGELEMGENTVRVTLNTNDHKEYAVDSESVADTVVITVDGHGDHSHVEHDHEHSKDSDHTHSN